MKQSDTGSVVRKVIQQYGWEPTQIQDLGGVWRVTCGDHVYALKKSEASREKLHFLHDILSKVQSAGFSHLLPWVPTKQGEPVVSLKNSYGYATPWKNSYGIEEKKRRPTRAELVKSLARFHRLAEPLVQLHLESGVCATDASVQAWKEKQAQIKTVAPEREFQSPFDKAWHTNQEKLDQSFSFAIRGLERFVQQEGGKAPRYTLCHRRLHPSNVVQEGDQFYYIDFDHAEIDTPVRDLAVVLRRVGLGSVEAPFELLEAYETELKLQPKEKRLLALYLAYPERALKLAHRYYQQPKVAQLESHAVRGLEAELQQLEILQDVIKSLWPSQANKRTSRPSKVQAAGLPKEEREEQ